MLNYIKNIKNELENINKNLTTEEDKYKFLRSNAQNFYRKGNKK